MTSAQILLACTVITCVVGVVVVNVVKAMVATDDAWENFFKRGRKAIEVSRAFLSYIPMIVGLGFAPLGFMYFGFKVLKSTAYDGGDIFLLVWYGMLAVSSLMLVIAARTSLRMVNRLADGIVSAFKSTGKNDYGQPDSSLNP